MNFKQLICLVGMLAQANGIWAYGSSSSSKKACEKPKFSQFSPPDKATVAAHSEFSFIASANTQATSIEVTVKNVPVTIRVDQTNQGYLIKGNLPETLAGTYARIAIKAEGTNRCPGGDGWLVNIAK